MDTGIFLSLNFKAYAIQRCSAVKDFYSLMKCRNAKRKGFCRSNFCLPQCTFPKFYLQFSICNFGFNYLMKLHSQQFRENEWGNWLLLGETEGVKVRTSTVIVATQSSLYNFLKGSSLLCIPAFGTDKHPTIPVNAIWKLLLIPKVLNLLKTHFW